MSVSRVGVERASLAELRQVVARIEGQAPLVAAAEAAGAAPWRFGVAAVDRAIGGRLATALHAVRAAEVGDVPAAHGFALAMAACSGRRGGMLWVATALHVREWGLPYAPGLARYGCDPAGLLVVEAKRPAEAGWVLEEALRSGAFALLVGAGLAVDFTASRRLALAAADRATPCLLVDAPARRGARTDASAASTIWHVAARLSAGDDFDADAPGHPRWRAELIRSRGSAPAGPWELDWDEGTHRFALAAAPADRTAAPSARPPAPAVAGAVRAERGRAARA
jgi:protein ImuA